jgi:hypothetical protein
VVGSNPTSDIEVPHIAIGCFKWEASEHKVFNQGNGRLEQLVAVLEDETAMDEYLTSSIDGQLWWKSRAAPVLRARVSSSCIKDDFNITLEGLGDIEPPTLGWQQICPTCHNVVPNRVNGVPVSGC